MKGLRPRFGGTGALKLLSAAAALICVAAIAVFWQSMTETKPSDTTSSELDALYFAEHKTETDTMPAASQQLSVTVPDTQSVTAVRERDLYEFSIQVEKRSSMYTVRGMMRLTYVNKSEDTLYSIVLRIHANDVEPNCTKISSVAADGVTTAYTLSEGDKLLTVSLPHEIGPNEQTQVFLRFEISVPETSSRFGINSTGCMMGNALPIAAMYENGAWRTEAYLTAGDSFYSRTSDYRVALSVPREITLAHTGTRVSEETEGSYTEYYISAPSVREFAFALITDGVEVTTSARSGRVSVHAIGESKKKAELAAKCAAAAIDFFSEKIGEYPYSDFYIVPFDLSGGMEYPGLIMTYKGDWKEDSAAGMLVIGHEAAHQWFYGVVGSDQINSPWLDEALAEYLGFEFLRYYAGEVTADKLEAERYSSFRKSYVRTKRLDASIKELAGADYFYVVYAYGHDFYASLVEEIGSGAFYEGLKTYYNSCYMGIGTKESLVSALSEAAGYDLTSRIEAYIASGVEE